MLYLWVPLTFGVSFIFGGWENEPIVLKQSTPLINGFIPDSRYLQIWNYQILWANYPWRTFPCHHVRLFSSSWFAVECCWKKPTISAQILFFIAASISAALCMPVWFCWPWWCVSLAPMAKLYRCLWLWCLAGAILCTLHEDFRCLVPLPSWYKK